MNFRDLIQNRHGRFRDLGSDTISGQNQDIHVNIPLSKLGLTPIANLNPPREQRIPSKAVLNERICESQGRQPRGAKLAPRNPEVRKSVPAINRSDLSFDPNAIFPQEIKVATELRAENRIRIQFGVSSCRSAGGPNLAAPVFKILFGNHNIDPAFSYTQLNLITSANKSQRTPYRCLW